jgi:GNAT superfamily N-acetyltransferase
MQFSSPLIELRLTGNSLPSYESLTRILPGGYGRKFFFTEFPNSVATQGLRLVVRYRTIRREDVGEVQRVARKAWMHTYGRTVPLTIIDRLLSDRYSDTGFRKRVFPSIAKGNSKFYLAVAGRKIIGYCYVRRGQRGWELNRIYLLPEYIGKGIGKELLSLGERFFNAKKARKYYAYVYSRNKLGLEFYYRNGFVRIRGKEQGPQYYLEKKL